MSLRRTSKDLNSSFFIETKSWQKYQSLSDSDKNSSPKKPLPKNPPKKIFPRISSQKYFPKNSPKKFSQKILPKKSSQKILQKNFSKKITTKKFRPKKSSQKISKKFPKNFKTKSEKNHKILKIFHSLHRTWRPKTLSGLFYYIRPACWNYVWFIFKIIITTQYSRSQNELSKKMLLKNSPKKFLPKNSFQKFPKKIPKKIQKIFFGN